MKLLLLNTFMLFLLFACNENIEIATENIIDNLELNLDEFLGGMKSIYIKRRP